MDFREVYIGWFSLIWGPAMCYAPYTEAVFRKRLFVGRDKRTYGCAAHARNTFASSMGDVK
jgi:hypothetical protein